MVMTMGWKRVVAVGVLMAAVFSAAGTVHAQGQAQSTAAAVQSTQAAQVPSYMDAQTAEEARKSFREFMKRFPSAVGRVLVLDPSLMTNASYLEAYPQLAQYLAAHPEVIRSPRYFLADYVESSYGYYDSINSDPVLAMRRESVNAWRNTFEAMLFFCGFSIFVLSVGWLVRYMVDHRRWLRSSKTQSEMHAKLLERFTSSEDLRAYMESPAGQSFLKASPLSTESVGSTASTAAPYGRILWSVQVGVVAVAVGIGFLIVKRGLEPEVAQMVGTWGTLAMALGIGFAASAGAAYVISSRLGLLDNRTGSSRQ